MMSKIINFNIGIGIGLLLLTLLATGCVKENLEPSMPNQKGEKVSVELNFKVPPPKSPDTKSITRAIAEQSGFSVSFFEEPQEVKTRSNGTTQLYNLWVFQFDAAGNKVTAEKVADAVNYVNDMATLNANLVVGSNQTLYIVVLGKQITDDLSTVTTIAQLESRELNYLSYSGAVYSSKIKSIDDIPYSGKVDGVNIVKLEDSGKGYLNFNTPTGFTGGVLIERLVSKISIKYKFDVAGYKMTGIIMKSVPEALTINAAKYAAGSSPVYVDLNAEVGSVADAQGFYTLEWYVAENRQGTKPLIGSENDRNSNNAPANATMMQVWAQNNSNANDYAVYQIYVGSNNTSNFDVESNGIYNLTTDINLDIATASNDDRVTSYVLSSDIELYASARSGSGSSSPSGPTYDLDAHYDFRPLVITAAGSSVTVEILDAFGSAIVNPADNWLRLSEYSNYTDAFQNSDLRLSTVGNLLVPSQLRYYLYADEYVDYTTTEKRSLTVRVTSTSSDGTGNRAVTFTLSQRPIVNLGYWGGSLGNNTQYESLLGVDQIDESNMKYSSIFTHTLTSAMPWGYHNVTTSGVYGTSDKENGKAATRALSENLSGLTVNSSLSNLDPPNGSLYRYNYYNTFAARYCYDRNRDENGDGVISQQELKWYLPAQAQLMGAWIQNGFDTAPFAATSYWSATENDATTSWNVSFNGGTTYNYVTKTNNYRVRCVRDL